MRIFDHVVTNTSRGAVVVLSGSKHRLEGCICWQRISGVHVEDNLGRDNIFCPPRLSPCLDRFFLFGMIVAPHYEVRLRPTVGVTHYVLVSKPSRVRLYETNTSFGQMFGPRVAVHLRRNVNDMPLAHVCQFGFEDVLSRPLQEFAWAGRLVSFVYTCHAVITPARDNIRWRGLARKPAYLTRTGGDLGFGTTNQWYSIEFHGG